MAVHSGSTGTIHVAGSEKTPCTNWTLESTSTNDPYVANDTAGWTKRTAGAKDSTGSFQLKDTPALNEGDSIAFEGYTGQDLYAQTVRIDRISVVTNLTGSPSVAWEIAFSGNGALVVSANTSP